MIIQRGVIYIHIHILNDQIQLSVKRTYILESE